MQLNTASPASVIHRALFQALLEIRDQGTESRNKVVFHLADLFHNVVLEMESAARGEQSFDDALRALHIAADERGLSTWLAETIADLEAVTGQSSASRVAV